MKLRKSKTVVLLFCFLLNSIAGVQVSDTSKAANHSIAGNNTTVLAVD